MSSGASVSGIAAMQRELRELREAMRQRAAKALYREAEEVMTRSKSEFVPVDLGTLRDSGMVSLPEIKEDAIVVELSFGGAAAAYALAVHENPSEFDPPSWRGVDVNFRIGGAKYLERPLNEASEGLMERVAKAAMED